VNTWNDPTGGFHPASAPDYLPRPRLAELQLKRLRSIVGRAYARVPFFRNRLEQRGLTPDCILRLEDLGKLPFTVKTDLRDTYPFGLFASPMEEIVRLHASSGTTGKPIVVAYTQADLEVWKQVMVRAFACYDLHRGDIIQNAYGYGLFTGGLGAHSGAEALGATVIPISGGNTERQLMVMQDFGATAICCTPSYFLHLMERAKEMKVDFSRLRVGVFGAEPWSEEMRTRIQEDTGIRGPGVGAECIHQVGLHIFEDHFYPEIIDPVSGEVLPEGAEGELVLTTLSKQAMPMIRYRTRDVTTLVTAPCPCGRTLRRIRRIERRSDDMFIIRGVNVFPSQIETALLRLKGTLPHYHIVLTREKGLDNLEVQVEVTPEVFSDKIRALESLHRELEHEIEQVIGIRAEVTLVEPRTLARSEGKAKRVTDNRKI
jgi:phenylacetate-CoA ligase